MQRVRTDAEGERSSERGSDEERCSLCVYGYNVSSTNGTRSSLSLLLLLPSLPRERLRALYHTTSMNRVGTRAAPLSAWPPPLSFVLRLIAFCSERVYEHHCERRDRSRATLHAPISLSLHPARCFGGEMLLGRSLLSLGPMLELNC